MALHSRDPFAEFAAGREIKQERPQSIQIRSGIALPATVLLRCRKSDRAELDRILAALMLVASRDSEIDESDFQLIGQHDVRRL